MFAIVVTILVNWSSNSVSYSLFIKSKSIKETCSVIYSPFEQLLWFGDAHKSGMGSTKMVEFDTLITS